MFKFSHTEHPYEIYENLYHSTCWVIVQLWWLNYPFFSQCEQNLNRLEDTYACEPKTCDQCEWTVPYWLAYSKSKSFVCFCFVQNNCLKNRLFPWLRPCLCKTFPQTWDNFIGSPSSNTLVPYTHNHRSSSTVMNAKIVNLQLPHVKHCSTCKC